MAVLIGLGAYLVFMVAVVAGNHWLVTRRETPHWWAHMDGPPPNVRMLDREKRR